MTRVLCTYDGIWRSLISGDALARSMLSRVQTKSGREDGVLSGCIPNGECYKYKRGCDTVYGTASPRRRRSRPRLVPLLRCYATYADILIRDR